jgi:hypothetical protein
MRGLVTLLFMLAVTACGGSTEANACPICGTWDMRYAPGTNRPIAHDPTLTLVLNADYTFTQGIGAPGADVEGSYSPSDSFIELYYPGVSAAESGTRRRGLIAGDSISFWGASLVTPDWIYKR